MKEEDWPTQDCHPQHGRRGQALILDDQDSMYPLGKTGYDHVTWRAMLRRLPFLGCWWTASPQRWAALIALINQQTGRNAGFLNPTLDSGGEANFFDINGGTNGAHQAAAGWGACTGRFRQTDKRSQHW